MKKVGRFTVSLDFEMGWGNFSDDRAFSKVPLLIEKILDCFERNSISATWASVGALGLNDFDELWALLDQQALEKRKHELFEVLAGRRPEDFFARPAVKRIANTVGQELATHSMTHFHALENIDDHDSFRADMALSVEELGRFGKPIESLVFPRNEILREEFNFLSGLGIKAYRGNPNRWTHRTEARVEESGFKRAARLSESYFSPLQFSSINSCVKHDSGIIEVGAGIFIRFDHPHSLLGRRHIAALLGLIERAANTGGVCHLWFHPHNLLAETEEKLALLESVCIKASGLVKEGRLKSLNMQQLAAEAN